MSGMLAAGAAASFKMPSPLLADHHGSNDKLKITSVEKNQENFLEIKTKRLFNN